MTHLEQAQKICQHWLTSISCGYLRAAQQLLIGRLACLVQCACSRSTSTANNNEKLDLLLSHTLRILSVLAQKQMSTPGLWEHLAGGWPNCT